MMFCAKLHRTKSVTVVVVAVVASSSRGTEATPARRPLDGAQLAAVYDEHKRLPWPIVPQLPRAAVYDSAERKVHIDALAARAPVPWLAAFALGGVAARALPANGACARLGGRRHVARGGAGDRRAELSGRSCFVRNSRPPRLCPRRTVHALRRPNRRQVRIASWRRRGDDGSRPRLTVVAHARKRAGHRRVWPHGKTRWQRSRSTPNGRGGQSRGAPVGRVHGPRMRPGDVLDQFAQLAAAEHAKRGRAK